MRAWSGDWKQRVGELVRRAGRANVWEYLRAHPAEPLPTIAARLGDAAPIQIRQLAVEHCLATREMPALIRDLMARSIRQHLPGGWGTAEGYEDLDAMDLGCLPRPYAELARALGDALNDAKPLEGWLPASGDDALLLSACEQGLASLSEARRELIAQGAVKARPGDAWWARVEPVWKEISIYDGPDVFLRQFGAVQPALGHLFAAHWCQGEVSNGGFSQFFSNSTGVLAPEALAGFAAIGMPKAAELVRRAIAVYPTPYPRDRYHRATVARVDGELLNQLDVQFYALVDSENGGFAVAADRYSESIAGSPWVEP
jgi:hypothetical protein